MVFCIFQGLPTLENGFCWFRTGFSGFFSPGKQVLAGFILVFGVFGPRKADFDRLFGASGPGKLVFNTFRGWWAPEIQVFAGFHPVFRGFRPRKLGFCRFSTWTTGPLSGSRGGGRQPAAMPVAGNRRVANQRRRWWWAATGGNAGGWAAGGGTPGYTRVPFHVPGGKACRSFSTPRGCMLRLVFQGAVHRPFFPLVAPSHGVGSCGFNRGHVLSDA